MKLSEEIIKKQGYKDAKFLAKFFNRTDRHIRKLTTDGILKGYMFKGAYYYELIPAIHAYIMYLTKLADEKDNILDDLNEEKANADIMYLRARAKKAQLEVKQLEGKLLPAEYVEDFTKDFINNIRREMISIIPKLSDEIGKYQKSDPAEVAEIIMDITNAALTNLSNYEYTPTPEFIKKHFPKKNNS